MVDFLWLLCGAFVFTCITYIAFSLREAGKKAQQNKQIEADVKAMLAKRKLRDELSLLDADARRAALREWVRPE